MDNEEIGMTKQVQLAANFALAFSAQIEECTATGAPSFLVSKKDLDEHLIATGASDKFYRLPSMQDKIGWSAWVKERQALRTALNSAAGIAQHGEPPYRIDQDEGSREYWRVQLLAGMVRVTFMDAVQGLKSLATNKQEDIKRLFGALSEHVELLPLEQRIMLNIQQKMFYRAAANVARAMNDLLEESQEYLVDTQSMIAAANKMPAITHQDD